MSKKEDTELKVGKFFTGVGKFLVSTAAFWGVALGIFALINGGDISAAQAVGISIGSTVVGSAIAGGSAIVAVKETNKKAKNEIAQLKNQLVSKDNRIVELENDNVDLTNQLTVANNTIATQQTDITTKDNEIQRLKNGAADIEAKASLAATFHGMAVGASDAAAKAAAQGSELVTIEEIKTKANNLKS